MPGFARSSAILFLNKADLLAEKLRDPQQQIGKTFDDFPGNPGSYNDAVNFFKMKFRDLKRDNQKELYIQSVPAVRVKTDDTSVTTATDTSNLSVAMAAVTDTIGKLLQPP